MPLGRRRLLVAVLLVALTIAIGLAVAWRAGAWKRSTPESRAHETVEQLRDRVRELTH